MPISQDAVRDGWIALLSRYSWDWFVTITFRGDYVHPESADKRWRLWCSILNRQLYGPRWYKKGKEIHWVRALELQKRGVIHYHALMTHPHDLNQLFSRMGQVNDLETIAGFSRIYPPRCNEAVTRYCAKYVIKGGELDVSPYLAHHGQSTSLRMASETLPRSTVGKTQSTKAFPELTHSTWKGMPETSIYQCQLSPIHHSEAGDD